ncbi:MAG TPA: sigma-70 family RNA polymerase sigma factor [Terriglobales bacterium]|nr:sigma-70 family RNA polymerase sigma factor [Terriglobales bacterium]
MAVRKTLLTESRAEAQERLLVEAAQKDPACFGELYEIHFERVYAYVAKRVGDRDAAEDLTSEVFHRALASLPRFDWRGIPFAVWLLRIAANLIVDRWKQVGREVVEDPPERVIEVCPVEVEHRARLFRMVELLPEDQRRVVIMRFAEEKSIKEIAGELGRTEGAVKQLQFRGLQNLRARMGGTHA